MATQAGDLSGLDAIAKCKVGKMATSEFGSLSKEVPLEKLEETIRAIVPGMSYDDLRAFAAEETLDYIPGLLRRRLLQIDSEGNIVYDEFLSLVASEGVRCPRARKVMYFVWALRDARVRRFICEVIADQRGLWRPTQISEKSNARFFEEWFEPATARKVRSNIEYFLVETGIFDAEHQTAHLELGDNWLYEAMLVASHHEPDPGRRRAMTVSPITFLISKKWQGLANATVDALLGVEARMALGPEPLDDSEISAGPEVSPRGRPWDRRTPKPSARASASAIIDLIARERASKAHWLLEKITVQAARAQGYRPKYNDQIDVYFETRSRMVIAEIKSCHRRNVHVQVRRGITQLLEYGFIYRELLGPAPTPMLVIETKPHPQKEWLSPYLESIGIVLAWKDPERDRLITTSAIPAPLEGVIFRS